MIATGAVGAPTGGAPLLECRCVCAGYGPVQILFDVDLDVHRGEIIAVLGANGAGKTTLLHAIVGAVKPVSGSVHFQGDDVTRRRPIDAARAGIALVSGGSTTFPTLTVAEHVRVGTWTLKDSVPADEVDRRIDDALDVFPRLRERWTTRGGDLSGGEQQQLALALAFMARPTLLMIDELSLGLAPIVVAQLLDSVRELHHRGTSVLIVEQSIGIALDLADRACLMEKGEIRFAGKADELKEHPDLVRKQLFHLGSPVTGRSAADGPRPGASPEQPAGRSTPALSVRGLTRRFGGISAVNDVSFDAHLGEVLGFVGPNGAGKTTVFDLISGFLMPNGGRITMGSTEVTAWSPHRRAMAGLGRSFQDSRLFPSLTVSQNLALGLDRHLQHRDQFAALLDLPAIQEMESQVARDVDQLLEKLGLGELRDVAAGELSTGTRRLVDLAMVVAMQPLVVLLDEPSSGVAQHDTSQIESMILDLRSSRSCALLVIEHDMGLLSRVSDELIAMDQGSVVARGQPGEVLSDPRIIESYLGADHAGSGVGP